MDECGRLRHMLDEEIFDKDENLYADLVNFIKKVSDHIFHEEKKIRKGVDKIMGGKLLVLESERLLSRGRKEGKAEGGNLKIYELVSDGLITPCARSK